MRVSETTLASIGGGTFYGCKSLTDITIPESVTVIEGDTFEDCVSLKSITIPKNVTSINYAAFAGCENLTSITFPDGLTEIGSEAFWGCSNLTSIIIPESVTLIDEDAFGDCSNLTSINIPKGIVVIHSGTFADCNLTSINLPKGIEWIGNFAFGGCSNLTSITIPESVTSIAEDAFEGCSKLTIYGYEGSYAQTYAAENGIPFKLITSISTEEPVQPSGSEQHIVELSAGKTSISSSSMQELVNINQTQDVVIKSTDGVVFTFLKGTMKMVDGKDSYDFGVKLITDYNQLTSKPFSKDDFAFRIEYNYEGDLPGTARISIPVDSKWVGKRLFYYRSSDDGTYTYQTSAVVDSNGMYTITQNHCSNYVSLAKKAISPQTGDHATMWLYAILVVSVLGIMFAVKRKISRNF